MREDLITLQRAWDAGPCADGWIKFLKAIGESAKFNPNRLFSVGDIAVSNGLDDALWCLRLLPPKLAVMAVMPAVKRSSVHTTDTRVHETISAVQRWIDGDTTVDLRPAMAASRAAVAAAEDLEALAAAWAAADVAWAATWAADPVRLWMGGFGRGVREAQLQDILSRFPPYALA